MIVNERIVSYIHSLEKPILHYLKKWRGCKGNKCADYPKGNGRLFENYG